METVKKDFIIFSAFLLSQGVRVAADVIRDYNESDDVFLSMDDLDYISEIVQSDSRFRKMNENFAQYLKYLMLSERDSQKLTNLKSLSDVLTSGGMNSFQFSMN
jgi:hypothetical protein